jgi:hypothetical protein
MYLKKAQRKMPRENQRQQRNNHKKTKKRFPFVISSHMSPSFLAIKINNHNKPPTGSTKRTAGWLAGK